MNLLYKLSAITILLLTPFFIGFEQRCDESNCSKSSFLLRDACPQKRSSPLGFEHVRAMTSMVFYKTHAGSTQLHIIRWLSLSSLVAPMVWI